MEHALITGAAGFIGSHLVERLLRRGDAVTAIDNFDAAGESPARKRANLAAAMDHPAFRLVEADCADHERIDAELDHDECTVIIHLAARPGVRPSIADPLGYVRANVTGTVAMLELAQHRQVERFILGSSASVYGTSAAAAQSDDRCTTRPISPEGASKAAAEAMAYTYHRLYRLSVACLRLFSVYGPRQRPDLAIRKLAARMLRDEPVPLFGDGSATRDCLWIDDAIDGVVAAIDRTARTEPEYQAFNLGTGRSTSVRRLIELVGAAVGTTPRVIRCAPQPGDVPHSRADIAKARALLDFVPSLRVEEGIPRFVEWLRAREARARPARALVSAARWEPGTGGPARERPAPHRFGTTAAPLYQLGEVL